MYLSLEEKQSTITIQKADHQVYICSSAFQSKDREILWLQSVNNNKPTASADAVPWCETPGDQVFVYIKRNNTASQTRALCGLDKDHGYLLHPAELFQWIVW